MKDFAAAGPQQAVERLEEARENGALIILNHPATALAGGRLAQRACPSTGMKCGTAPGATPTTIPWRCGKRCWRRGARFPPWAAATRIRLFRSPGTATPATTFLQPFRVARRAGRNSGRALLHHAHAGRRAGGTDRERHHDGRHGRPAQQYTLQFDVQGLVCGDEILLVNENGLFRKWQASVSRERRTLEVPEALFYRLEVRRTFRGAASRAAYQPVYLK